jgi:phosphoglycolate phosphatase-like HAD superfamily hydrolase
MSASTAPDDAVDRARHPVPGAADTVVLDVDGTLVDSVFHHVTAWDHAFAEVGVEVPLWRLHRAIGMGGDRLVAAVAGDAVEDGVGDVVRAAHDAAYERLFRSVRLLPGADSLITRLHEQGWRVAVASSGSAEQTDAAMSLVADAHRADAVLSSADVEASKPATDLARAALDAAGGTSGVLVGDTVWDVRTATELGSPCLGVLTGGVSRAELEGAGAFAVVEAAGDVPAALEALAPRTATTTGTGTVAGA